MAGPSQAKPRHDDEGCRSRVEALIAAAEIPTLAPVLAGIDAAIGYPQPITNDATPISNHPMKMRSEERRVGKECLE